MDNNSNNLQLGQVGMTGEGGQMGMAGMSGPIGVNGQAGSMAMPAQPLKPMKQPMDPAKKKRIILAVILGLVAVVVIVVAIVIIMVMMKVDYGETYRVAKELKTEMYDFVNNEPCREVNADVTSSYLTIEEYSKDIEGCRKWGDGLTELVDKLGETSAVKRDAEIKKQYDRYREGVLAVLPNREDLEKKLVVSQAWQKYEVLLDDLKATSTDAEVQAAANALINSGNDTLKTYGEGWLEKTLDYTRKYQAWQNAPYSDYENKRALLDTSNAAHTEQRNWVSANKPDIKQLANIDLTNVSKVGGEFDKLYRMITKRYEENYDSESGDCLEFLGSVTCS